MLTNIILTKNIVQKVGIIMGLLSSLLRFFFGASNNHTINDAIQAQQEINNFPEKNGFTNTPIQSSSLDSDYNTSDYEDIEEYLEEYDAYNTCDSLDYLDADEREDYLEEHYSDDYDNYY